MIFSESQHLLLFHTVQKKLKNRVGNVIEIQPLKCLFPHRHQKSEIRGSS